MTTKKTMIYVLFSIALIFSVAPFVSPTQQSKVDNAWEDLLYSLRGSRAMPDDFVFVYLDSEDIAALGGWPITRDYYGYMTHVLKENGAKVIAYDMLFNQSAPKYAEHDEVFAQFIATAANVCLPMYFENNSEDQAAIANASQLPLPAFREHLAGMGFTNLEATPVLRKTRVVATSANAHFFAFGAELARVYLGANIQFKEDQLSFYVNENPIYHLPLDGMGRIHLNHFGGLEHIRSIPFIELLQSEMPDTLALAGKLVLIGATAPGMPVLRATPLRDVFPAGLIHLTLAENIIHQNYLRTASAFWHPILVLLMILVAFFLWRYTSGFFRIMFAVGFWLVCGFLCIYMFSMEHTIIPFFYPTFAYLSTFVTLYLLTQKAEIAIQQTRGNTLQKHITEKSSRLEVAKTNLETLQAKLANTSEAAAQQQAEASAQEQTILQMEKEIRDLQSETLPDQAMAPADFPGVIHSEGGAFSEILQQVRQVSHNDIPVLINGETGTGKELIARAVHQTGSRKDRTFVAVNCGALSENLLESELFGHEKGAFTGANTQRKGRFELANGGTLFLDEITETTPAFQAKLLRVIQEGKFERIGGEDVITVNVRFIAATNRDLQKEMADQRFRADLFYRLNGFPIQLPPLRERTEDIPLLAAHFLQKHAVAPVNTISGEAMNMLKTYHWPGNVRELENAIRRAAILAQSSNRKMVRLNDLPAECQKPVTKNIATDYQSFDAQVLASLRHYAFSRSAITETARALGNRDRGTITEYFRGICFQMFVENHFNHEKTVEKLAATDDPKTLERVSRKLSRYLENLSPLPERAALEDEKVTALSQFKGLPKKYHPFLKQVIIHLLKK